MTFSTHSPQSDGMQFSLLFFASGEDPTSADKYRLLMESATFADRHGFSAIWLPERHFTAAGCLYPNPAVLQAALSQVTQQIQLRAGSVVLPLHHPVRIAEEWSMVDNLSKGRAGIAAASGWHPNDFVLAPEQYSDRQEALFRQIQTVQQLWQGESIRLINGNGEMAEVKIHPTPIQPSLPIWVTAAGNPQTFIRAGEVGANLLTHLFNQSIDEVAEKIRLYRQARAEHGHDPEAGQVALMLHTFIGEHLDEVNSQVREAFGRYLQSGGTDFLKGVGVSRGQNLDLSRLSQRDLDDYLNFVINRLINENRVLFGTQESCFETITKLKAVGVDEIACQLDFGVKPELILKNLPYLNEFKNACNDSIANGNHQELKHQNHMTETIHLSDSYTTVELTVEETVESDWFYAVEWQPKPIASPTMAHRKRWGSWLIFADQGGTGQRLAAQLRSAGNPCVLVFASDTYEQVAKDQFRLNPAQPEQIDRLLQDALGADQPACQGVIHLWSLDIAASDSLSVAELNAVVALGTGSALHLLQALAKRTIEERSLTEPPRLWLVTQSAQAVANSAPLAVAQSPLWGLSRAIPVEHPALWGGLIDLDAASPIDQTVFLLLDAIWNTDGEDMVAFRQGQRYVARLVRQAASDHASDHSAVPTLRSDSAYLVTGGFGGIGLEVAQWFAEAGAQHLVLVGRTPLPDRSQWSQVEAGSAVAQQIAAIQAMEAAGATLHLVTADVANQAEMAAALATLSQQGCPAIRGVVHSAGIWQDRALLQLDQTALSAVLQPKVAGSWVLHRLFENTALDFMVYCSSIASLMTTHGQANYAAANAFLDAMAHYRRAQGQPAVSINWGPWSEVGFATTAAGIRSHSRLERNGIGRLSPAQGRAAMQAVLRSDAVQLGIVAIDWPQLVAADPAAVVSPLLADQVATIPALPTSTPATVDLASQLAAAPTAEAEELIMAYLRIQVAKVLGLEPAQLNIHQSLTDFGIDSLMAVEMKNRLLLDLGVDLPLGKLLEGSSLVQVTNHVLTQRKLASLCPSEFSLATASDEHEEIEL